MTAFGAALILLGLWVLVQGLNGNAGRLLQGQITLGSLGLGKAGNLPQTPPGQTPQPQASLGAKPF